MNGSLNGIRSAVDWLYTARTIREFVVTAAACVGAYVAWQGLSTWRRQMRGNTEYELARRMMKAALQVRNGLTRVRDPHITAPEVRTAIQYFIRNENVVDIEGLKVNVQPEEEEYEHEQTVHAYRWQTVYEGLDAIALELVEAEVIWGPAVKDAVQPLDRCAVVLRLAIDKMFYRKGPELFTSEFAELGKVVYATLGEPDQFAKRIDEAVQQIEDFLSPYLKLKYHLASD